MISFKKLGNIQLEQIYKKMRHREDGTFVQDVIFYIFHCTDFQGELIKKTEFQENFWATVDEAKKMDTYGDLSLPKSPKIKKFKISTNIGIAKDY